MKTPFEILNVDETASDEAIKDAYLRKVKQYPPEHAPEQFQQIRAAYEQIRTETGRVQYYWFQVPPPEPIDVAEHCLTQQVTQRPPELLLMKTLSTLLTLPDIATHG
ncbi:MAG: J domain-containing protein [Thiotrichaceae bacterium]